MTDNDNFANKVNEKCFSRKGQKSQKNKKFRVIPELNSTDKNRQRSNIASGSNEQSNRLHGSYKKKRQLPNSFVPGKKKKKKKLHPIVQHMLDRRKYFDTAPPITTHTQLEQYFLELYHVKLPDAILNMFDLHECKLCSVKFSNSKTIRVHYESKNHGKHLGGYIKNNIEALVQQGISSKSLEPFYCCACKSVWNNKKWHRRHYKSKDHVLTTGLQKTSTNGVLSARENAMVLQNILATTVGKLEDYSDNNYDACAISQLESNSNEDFSAECYEI